MEAANPPNALSESRRTGIKLVIALAALMWLFEIVDSILGGDLDAYGIEPRDTDGLAGILASPFLHAGFGHLFANTIPFVILGVVIAFGGAVRVLAVTAIVALVSGLGTWLIAPENTIHIGASGVVFGYATYLIARGIFNRDLLEIAVGLVVGAVWGGTLLAGLEPQEGISWQGHLFGAIGGVIAAAMLKREAANKPAAT
ncbi:MAG: rhomboid family intramembrane serine protease [Thermoleophilaceae bacterium]|nr:rhomboid family intramembrane serine protease [Thermoleophilaceae bacterium]